MTVCSPTGSPDCRGPCDACEDYCEPVQQQWCELSHSIHTQVQYSTVQYSTVQYSTVQYSTVQYITVQYSTVQYNKEIYE